MKKIISLFMAVLFVLTMFPAALADETAAFTGVVVSADETGFTVENCYGTAVAFVPDGTITIPTLGDNVTIGYTGNIGEELTATAVTVNTQGVQGSISGTVSAVDQSTATVVDESGNTVELLISELVTITGKGSIEVGDTVNATYVTATSEAPVNADGTAGTPVVTNIATSLEVLELVPVKITEDNTKSEDTTNKKLSGTIIDIGDKTITIKTSKGRKWTFKRSKKTQVRGKEMKIGAKCTITYDGYASKHPLAKRIKVTKSAPAPSPTTKKYSGVCCYYKNKTLGIEGAQIHWDTSKAKNVGKGKHKVGTRVTVTYYYKNGTNYATKVNWKAN